MNQSATTQVRGAHHCQHQFIKMLHLCRDKVCWTCKEIWTLLEQLPNRTFFAFLRHECVLPFHNAPTCLHASSHALPSVIRPRQRANSNGTAHSAFTKLSKSFSSHAQVLPMAKLLCHTSASWQVRLRSVENAAKIQPARGGSDKDNQTLHIETKCKRLIWRHQRWLAVGRSRGKMIRTRGDIRRVMMSHDESCA